MKNLSWFTLILLTVLLLTSFTLTALAEPVTVEVWFHSGTVSYTHLRAHET